MLGVLNCVINISPTLDKLANLRSECGGGETQDTVILGTALEYLLRLDCYLDNQN